jgi:hypothetical protein
MTATKNGVVPQTLRILCIHDNGSNALALKNEFRLLGEKLYQYHSIDLVYVKAPLTSEKPTPSDETHKQCYWWEEGEVNTYGAEEDSAVNISSVCDLLFDSGQVTDIIDNHNDDEIENVRQLQHSMLGDKPNQASQLESNDSVRVTSTYIGLDASLMLLRQIWTSCPFWGILGVGHGAAIASLFVTLLESETVSFYASDKIINEEELVPRIPLPPNLPQLMIYVSGESLILVDEPLLISDHYNTNPKPNVSFILHLVDSNVSSGQELLIRQFPQGCKIEQRDQQPELSSKNRQRFNHRDLNIIGRFICELKKGLYGINDHQVSDTLSEYNKAQIEILALQTALYNAEQDATNCITETITLNPPASLMAVIRPQLVAGWIGNRRPQPEGGGAPCPEEFLHKDKYSKDL